MTGLRSAPQRAESNTAPDGWDSDLYVIRGGDRSDLLRRVSDLSAFIESNPHIRPVDLAATLAEGVAAGGARLSVIASSLSDLDAKLARAAGRLADPKCRQIRDAAGLYFFSEPLYAPGTVALLFPGEGAQYLNMLADLCEPLPEVGETFDWCDRVAAEIGRPEASLRSILHPPADATPEERAAAEAQLRKIGPSLLGVLLADMAVLRVIQKLELPVSATAGHSAGELAALMAAGAMGSEEFLGTRLFDALDVMDRQEDEASGADLALIAVGAGKATVTDLARTVAGGGLTVAMDNCPHQCVAVGPTHLVAAVEAALAERGVLCERLPFKRPYHTPLFEPWMGPFRELFRGIPITQSRIPVYCGTTGTRFPDDPAEAHRLSVEHWVHPVEFVRMIESMHADGIRIFVEAGPRGNLSAFTEDILRGKPFAAIPANLPKRSGPTQINHMVGQLVAHGVPVNLGHLFVRRSFRKIAWEQRPAVGTVTERSPDVIASFMNDYLAVMEQFLDVQSEVMGAYLADSGSAPSGMDGIDGLLPVSEVEASSHRPLCFIGWVERQVPGKEVVIRRVLDRREDLYADHHTLGGRDVSRVDPHQAGLPILPMTCSLEAMAQAATVLMPGKVAIAIKNLRLHRWVPFDPEPTILEIRATILGASGQPGTIEVAANVRDLGNSFLKDGANKVASEAVVVLADRYPEPPEPLPFELTDEAPCRATVPDLRRNMFHGPLFWMIRSLDRYGKEGIEGTLEVQPRDGWFRSNPDPVTLLDPILTDAAMHIIGAWHLEQPDWSGRILLPIGLSKIEYFGPPPAPGTRMTLRGHNEEETTRYTKHGLEIFGPDGKLWLRLTTGAYWRFYLPFMHVNYFGPKDEYYLSRSVPEAVTPGPLRRCHYIDPPPDLKQPVLRVSGVKVSMTPREEAEFLRLSGPESAKDDWFFGRLTAKDAARAVWAEKYPNRLFPADIESEEVDDRLTLRFRGEPGPEPLPPVALAVVNGKVAAFSAFAERVGVGLAVIPKKASAEDVNKLRREAAARAVADALRAEVADFVVEAVDPSNGLARVGLGERVAARYSDLARRVRVQTGRHQDAIIATTTCEAADP